MGELSIVNVSGFLSIALGLFAGVPYIVAVLKGKTKPHQMGWMVWAIVNVIVVLTQYYEGARASLLISVAALIITATVFILSLKYGLRDTSKWDRLLFALALITILIWYLTKNNSVAIWLTVLVDIFAASMTLLKAEAQPSTENALPWGITGLAYFFTCITLYEIPVGILYVRPYLGLFANLGMAGIIYYFNLRPKQG